MRYQKAMSRQLLLIEDNPDLSEMSCRMLEMHGYEVICAFTGKQAIKTLEIIEPDLILLDLTLPDMEPREFRDALDQSIDQSIGQKQIPLVILSGRDDTKKWAADIRADGHMGKPYEFKKLLALVEKLIG